MTLVPEGMLVLHPEAQHMLCNMKYNFHKSSLLVPTPKTRLLVYSLRQIVILTSLLQLDLA
jgi:hypothetical protein